MSGSGLMWQPDPDRQGSCNLARFISVAVQRGHVPADTDYAGLYAWSLEQPAAFWSAVADFCALQFASPPETVFTQDDPNDMRTARWFSGARLNFAENLLRDPDDSCAVICCDERGTRRELSRSELQQQVAALAAGMRAMGVRSGDRVAVLLPNCVEAVVSALAAASIGAVFSSCSPDFGREAILARFAQISPRLLIACDGYTYGGKEHDCIAALRDIVAELPAIERLLVVPVLNPDVDLADIPNAQTFAASLIPGAQPEYRQLPFAHPLYILYSSGTTGAPKCIVHGAGGTLLQHLKEHVLHTDLRPGDRLFYFTTCGWMMWNWLISALAAKATIVLYDGSPFYPDPAALLKIARRESLTVFGTSPRYLTALQNSAVAIPRLAGLRQILSTGAPLAPANYDFVRSAFGAQVQLASISGGTDIISCFALGNPLLPVYRGELQCRGLGMAVDVYDADGCPVVDEKGELVCTQAFPSMPLGFFGDPDGAAYSAAYFEQFAGVWTHGDYAVLTPHGGLVILGRSDTVLNPGGVRIGSAEVCQPAMTVAGVSDCMAVGHAAPGGEEIVLFVALEDGFDLTDELTAQIRASIRASASPRHVPAQIIRVPAIPQTRSGKPVEKAVRAVLAGEPVTNLSAIANPEVLEYFRLDSRSRQGQPDSG